MSGVHSPPRARKKLFKHHLQSVRSLALLEQELWLHSVEIEESPGTASSGPSVVLGATVTLTCSRAALECRLLAPLGIHAKVRWFLQNWKSGAVKSRGDKGLPVSFRG